jgi:ubiquitin C-terminal hydrolase
MTEEIYDVPELKQHPYMLHSILMHEGTAGQGHYFTYIIDPEHNKWWKYSDYKVEEVPTEEVIENAVGGTGPISAYCFFYVRPDIINAKSARKSLRQHSIVGINEA